MTLDQYPDLMTTKQLAELLGLAKHTIEVGRCEGTFPIPHRNPFNNRTIRYAKVDVLAHLEGCMPTSPLEKFS